MADLTITKPSQGQEVALTPDSDSRLVFDFSVANVTLKRKENSLIFSFEDESSVTLEDFYSVYTAENMPSFLIEGEEVAGESFFAALDEDLMPAAGNTTSTAEGSGSTVDTIAGTLLGGIDRLGRLDQERESSDEVDFSLTAAPGIAVAEGFTAPEVDLNTPPVITDVIPSEPNEEQGSFENVGAHVGVVESGVGRDADGNITSESNQEYGGKLVATGQVVATDADGDTLSYVIVGTGTGNYGSITIDPDTGEFVYVLDDNAAQSLAEGQNVQESFEVEVSDGKGGTTSTTITVNIAGTNDAPSLSVDESLSITEDSSLNASGKAQSFDSDNNAEQTFFVAKGDAGKYDDETSAGLNTSGLTKEGSVLQGDYGSFTIEADGTYTYNVDNDAIQHLGKDDFIKESFTIYVQDDKGAWKSEVVTVTVNGANDAPTIVQPEVDPNPPVDPNDPDNPNPPTDPTDPETPIKPGTSDLSIGVVEQGVADDGTTEGFDPNTNFDGRPTATGTIVATDVDDAASELTFTIQGDAQGKYGSLTMSGNEYTYTLNQGEGSAADKLAAGETKTETFTIRVEDPHGGFVDQQVTVTVTGTNDQPTLSVDKTTLTLTEDVAVDSNGNLVATGQATGADVDNGANLSYGLDAPTGKDDALATEKTGQYGTFSIDPTTGQYTYTVNNDSVQNLGLDADGKPETVTESFDIYVRDEHGAYSKQTITVTVNGANDAPEIVQPEVDPNPPVDPNDPDNPNPPTDPTDPETPIKPGTSDLSIGVVEQGVADNGTTEDFDPNTNFDGRPTATGTIVATDVDDAASELTFTIQGDAQGKYGSLTMSGNEYTYTLNQGEGSAADKLAAGETKTETFTIRVEDPHGGFVDQQVTVTVTGTNDQPTLSVDKTTLTLTEDVNVDDHGNIVATGQATGADVDNGAVLSYGLDAPTSKDDDLLTEKTGQYGTFSIDPSTGQYTYTVDNDSVQHLGLDADGKPETVTESFDIYVRDEHGAYSKQTITVTVNGANDAPTIVQPEVDPNPPVDPNDPDNPNPPTDPNDPETPIKPGTSDLSIGVVEQGVADDGTTEGFDPNTNFDGRPTATGTIVATDADDAASELSFTIQGDAQGKYGSLTMSGNEYTYTLNQGEGSAADKLAAGETKTENFTIRVEDPHGGFVDQQVTVTVTGTNDQPTLSVDKTTLTLTEDVNVDDHGNIVATGQATGADVDNGANLSYGLDAPTGKDDALATEQTGQYGTFSIDPTTGEYTYTVDNDSVQHLGLDADGKPETVTESFDIYVRDEHGAYSKQTITVTVNGANDAPTIVQPEVDPNPPVDPNDPDNPNPPTDPTDPETPIKPGTSDLSIGVVEQGVADDGTTEDFDPNTNFDGRPTATGTIVATDVDNAASELTFTIQGDAQGKYGSLTMSGNEYTYTLNQGEGSAADKLAAGETKTETFTIRVEDPHGGFVDQQVTVTVTGTNDQPTLSVDKTTLTLTEDVNVDDHGNIVATGQATGADVDNGANLSYGLDAPTGKDDALATEQTGQYGTFSIDPTTGEYTYTVDNDSVQNLGLDADGKPETVTESFDIYVRDEHGAYSKQTITVTVNGANDAPTIVQPEVDPNPPVDPNDPDNPNPPTDPNDPETPIKPGTSDLSIGVVEQGVADDGITEGFDPNTNFDGRPTATGTIVATDVDDAASELTFTIQGDAQGKYGSLTMSGNEYTYTLNQGEGSAADKLAAGETKTETFTIRVEDPHGGFVDQQVTVTVTGTNDQPTLSVDKTTLTLTEDVNVDDHGNIVATGQATGADVDNGANLSYGLDAPTGKDDALATEQTGQYGTFSIDPTTGEYTYTVDNDSVQNLGLDANGNPETVTESFDIYVRDEHGAYSKQTITVTVNGANDAPTIVQPEVDPNPPVDPNDPDNPNPPTDPTDPETPIKPGTSDLSIGVVEQGVADDGTTEDFDPNTNFDGRPTATGTIVATDVDDAASELTFTIQGDAQGKYGSLTMSGNEYTYTLNQGEGSAADKLAAGETKTETFTIRVEDPHGGFVDQQVTVTVTGTNDQPTLSVDKTTLTLTEDVNVDDHGNIVATGQATGADVDNGANLSYGLDAPTGKDDALATEQTGQYGTFSIDPTTGQYTYTVDNDSVQNLGLDADGKPETVTESFDIYVRDEHGAYSKQTITVTVNGANDAPEIVPPKDPDPENPGDVATVTKTDLTTSDKNLNDSESPASDTGQIVFTSEESMDGGKITIGDTTFTVVENPDGSYSLSPPDGDDFKIENADGYGNLIVDKDLAFDSATGEFTLSYTYEQTKNYNHDDDINNDRKSDNDHDQMQENAESFDVFIQDGKESVNSTEGLETTIKVDISDDGPSIVGDESSDQEGHGESTAVLDGNIATAELEVDFGGDGPGKILLNTGATYEVGVEWVNGGWQAIPVNGLFFPNAPVVTYTYNEDTKEHILKMGDVTLTSTDNTNWEISYEVNPEGREPVGLTFEDSDGDSVKHSINSPTPEKPEEPTPPPPVNPDISSQGELIDNITILDNNPHGEGGLVTNWQGSFATNNPSSGTEQVANKQDVYDKDGYTIDVGIANDVVQTGQYNDTIYLGEGHVTSQDNHAGTELLKQQAQESMEQFMFGTNDDGTLREDSTILTDANNEDSALATEITALSRPFVDMAHGGGGNDTIYGEEGVDLIFGGSGNDTIYGGEGNDGLRGGSGDDSIYGGEGNDVIYGGLGSDFLDGGSGDDFILGDINDTYILGGEGSDLIKVDLSTLGDIAKDALRIDGGDDDDSVDVLLAGVNGMDAAKELINNGNIENIEVIIAGGNIEGENVNEVLDNLNIKDGDAFNPSDQGWTASASQDLSSKGYTEFSKVVNSEEITILVQTNLITS